eukprot:1147009-Pelagomonas_calceolata.AAC.6
MRTACTAYCAQQASWDWCARRQETVSLLQTRTQSEGGGAFHRHDGAVVPTLICLEDDLPLQMKYMAISQ